MSSDPSGLSPPPALAAVLLGLAVVALAMPVAVAQAEAFLLLVVLAVAGGAAYVPGRCWPSARCLAPRPIRLSPATPSPHPIASP